MRTPPSADSCHGRGFFAVVQADDIERPWATPSPRAAVGGGGVGRAKRQRTGGREEEEKERDNALQEAPF